MDRYCINCEYRRKEAVDDGYICTNPDSEYIADWVEDNHWCEDFTERNDVEDAKNE